MTTLEALVSRALEMVHSFREPRAKTSPRDGTQVSAQEPRWSRGPIAQQLAARFAFAPITRPASHSYRRRTRRTASEGLAAAGVGFLRRNACAALRLKLTPNAIRGLKDGVSSSRGLRTKNSRYCA
jgi:hypothetical protein